MLKIARNQTDLQGKVSRNCIVECFRRMDAEVIY